MNFIPGDWVIVVGYPDTLLHRFVGQVIGRDSDGYILTKFSRGKLHMYPSKIKPWVCKLGRW